MRARKSLQLQVIVLALVFALLIAITVSASSVMSAYRESCREIGRASCRERV